MSGPSKSPKKPQIRTRNHEFGVRHLRKGISELRAEADQEQQNYEREANKLNRGYRPGNSDGGISNASPGRSENGGMGYGYGGGMGSSGRMVN